MTADFTKSDVWIEERGMWERRACANCAHAGLDTRYPTKVPICTHEDVRGISIDRPTQFSSRMRGSACGPQGKLYEERK